jgi:NitT/TauT family transport system permease protein
VTLVNGVLNHVDARFRARRGNVASPRR